MNSELIGHQKILKYLEQCLRKNTLAHAYLLLGPSGIGRMKLLEIFAPQLVNMQPAGLLRSPASAPLQRGSLPGRAGAMTLQHPDISITAPEEGLISIETIRKLRAWLQLSPLASKAKVAIIDHAERMNTQAQSAFLKALEEPEANTYIFLLAATRGQLLPTIVSRTVPVYFNPVPIMELWNYGIMEKDAVASHGKPGLSAIATSNRARIG